MMLFIGLVQQLDADVNTGHSNEGGWVQTNGPYGGDILPSMQPQKGYFSLEQVARVSSVQRIVAILGHRSILDYVLNPERVFGLLRHLRRRGILSMLARGMVYTHQPMVATHGITFRPSKVMSQSVVLWLLRTAYTSAP